MTKKERKRARKEKEGRRATTAAPSKGQRTIASWISTAALPTPPDTMDEQERDNINLAGRKAQAVYARANPSTQERRSTRMSRSARASLATQEDCATQTTTDEPPAKRRRLVAVEIPRFVFPPDTVIFKDETTLPSASPCPRSAKKPLLPSTDATIFKEERTPLPPSTPSSPLVQTPQPSAEASSAIQPLKSPTNVSPETPITLSQLNTLEAPSSRRTLRTRPLPAGSYAEHLYQEHGEDDEIEDENEDEDDFEVTSSTADEGAEAFSEAASSSDAHSESEPTESEPEEELVRKIRQRKPTKTQSLRTEPSTRIEDGPVDKGKNLMKNLVERKESRKGVHEELPPLSKIHDIFDDLTTNAVNNGLDTFVQRLHGRPLRVATMCSGTESPLLALEMITDCLRERGAPYSDFAVEHVFSAEIEPFKQAYIERNFHPPVIFRDIVDITRSEDGMATTAYGAKVQIPDNVDIVIAGTSCVDFSGLNRMKKGLDDEGESGDTFNAVLNYAKRYRPRILILENVFGAPWNRMLAKYEANGYSSAGVLVDTKEYYIPHTRNRGYMICIDRQTTGLSEAEGADIGKEWQNNMELLKRAVSAPISAFLLPNDDGEVTLSRDRITRQSVLDPTLREVDWSKCEERHKNYRQKTRLGNSKPYTSWEPSGTLVINDYADTAWHRRQVERVWDFEECSVLRKAREYDVQFKTRIWDVSQNIDRYTDGAPFGISSCLTPSGNFFVTDRGGPLTFAESLALQGLPLDKLEFVSETERQVQDLAGNAMSTTVVGAALAAALISATDVLAEAISSRERRVAVDTTVDKIAGLDQLVRKQVGVQTSEVSAAQLARHATATAKHCYCEGQISIATSSIQKCVDCGHTTCVTCGVKPVHKYERLPEALRQSPDDFLHHWRSKMPMRLRLENTLHVKDLLKKSMARCSSKITFETYLDVILNALSGDYKFSHFRRSWCWTVVYEAKHARLVLSVDAKGCVWSLYGIPASHLPGNDVLRSFLQRPIAKSKADLDNILGSHWEWRVPNEIKFNLKMRPSGDRIPAWTARLNLHGSTDKLPLTLDITYAEKTAPTLPVDVSGTYTHLRKCGTACEALYRRLDHPDAEPLFLFLDPMRLGPGSDDKFVFSSNPERLQYDEARDVIASLRCSWRPWCSDISSAVGEGDCQWLSDSQMSLHFGDDPLEVGSHASKEVVAQHTDCSEALALATCDFHVSDDIPKCFQGVHQIRPNDKAYFNTFAYALEPMRPFINLDEEHIVPSDHALSCDTCAPPLPGIHWSICHTSKTKQGLTMRPFEDHENATVYEKRLKTRPNIFVLQSTIGKDSGTIEIGLNHLALAQRAFAKLRRSTRAGYQSTSWTLDTSFSKHLTTDFAKFNIPSTDPNKSFDTDLPGDSKVKLWVKQQQVLAWMRSQEAGEGKKIVLEAVEEATLPHLGFRAEACSKAALYVRGGITADHPGFGKTINSLALIHAEFHDHKNQADPAKEIIRSMKDIHTEPGEVPPIKISATLVVLPRTIVKQWEDEVKKVLGTEYLKKSRTLVIENMRGLEKLRIKDFQGARIILLNREILGRDTYLSRLAYFAGVPIPGSGSAKREFGAWLNLATREVRAHAEHLTRNGASSVAKLITGKFKDRLQQNTMRSFASMKRLKGKEYMQQKELQHETGEEDLLKAIRYKVEVGEIRDTVLFEMFHYNRIIVDEFSYILSNKDGAFTSITSLAADKRWALSATPPMRDPYDVAKLARLLGINLPGGLNVPGVVSTKNLEALQEDLTNAELFETFRNAPSHALQSRIHNNAQRFLDDFARQNILKFDDSVYNDYIFPVALNLDHRIVYTELLQHFNSQDMRVKKLIRANTKGQDREARIHEVSKDADDAESALSNRAAFFSNSVLSGVVEMDENEEQTDKAKKNAQDAEILSLAKAIEVKLPSSSLLFGKAHADQLLKKRREELVKHRRDLIIALCTSQKRHFDVQQQKAGRQKDNEYPFETWQDVNLAEHDDEIIDVVKRVIADAEKKYPTAKRQNKSRSAESDSDEIDDGSGSAAAEEKKESKDSLTSPSKAQNAKTSKALKKYIAAVRAVRFVTNAYKLQSLAHKHQGKLMCDFQGCNGQDVDTSAVSSVCGHVVCDICFEASQINVGMCNAEGCKSPIKSSHLLHVDKMVGRSSLSDVSTGQGRKIDHLVELLQDIRKHKEQAILFVRRNEDIKRIADVLEKLKGDSKVGYVAVDTDVGNRIKQFQKDDKEKEFTVIILNANDESAAGTNLTGANHVIFLSPLLKPDQYGYESQMAQAIGRVRRPGQKRKVHVYRMVALNTTDVDVLEHRERTNRVLVQKPDDVWAEDEKMGDAASNEQSPFTAEDRSASDERTQLIKDKDGTFKLVPKSLLLRRAESKGTIGIEGRNRVKGFDDYSSLVKFSKAYSMDD